jgi:hypothetical protein
MRCKGEREREPLAEEKRGEEQLGTTPANAFGVLAPYEIFCASPSLNRQVFAAAAAGVGCCCLVDFVEVNLLSFFRLQELYKGKGMNG